MIKSILVVCTGNICRSPIAERLLRQALPSKKVDSAGVGALVGQGASSLAVAVARQNGISLEGHKGTQFTGTIGRQYELILVMEQFHIEQISRIAEEARGKTMLLGQWLGQREIPDPYQKSEEVFEFVYQLIDQACQSWVEKLNR